MLRFYLDLCLICCFTFLRTLFIWTSGYVTSIVSITHAVIFSKEDVLRRRACMVAQDRIIVCETMGR